MPSRTHRSPQISFQNGYEEPRGKISARTSIDLPNDFVSGALAAASLQIEHFKETLVRFLFQMAVSHRTRKAFHALNCNEQDVDLAKRAELLKNDALKVIGQLTD
jgi:hypothetical protein